MQLFSNPECMIQHWLLSYLNMMTQICKSVYSWALFWIVLPQNMITQQHGPSCLDPAMQKGWQKNGVCDQQHAWVKVQVACSRQVCQ